MDLPLPFAAAIPTARKNKAKEIFMGLDVDESSVKTWVTLSKHKLHCNAL